MGTYGRHFEFRNPPEPEHRLGRYVNSDTAILIGSPVAVDTAAGEDAQGRLTFELCTSAVAPKVGFHGLAIYEYPTANKDGFDPQYTTFSDLDTVPALEPCQLVHGTECKIALWTYDAVDFQGQRDYAARRMVAGVAIATPTVGVGDMLTPGNGNDTLGYWVETADPDLAWLNVTAVDNDLGLVEAYLRF